MPAHRPLLAEDYLLRMSRTRALELDQGDFIADFDDELAAWCVFGVHSGFCYSRHETEDAAETAASKSHVRKINHV